MGRYLSWLANGVLFVACCFLLASTANTIFAALMTPAPVRSSPETTRDTSRGRDFDVILDRNIFNASLLAPPVPAVDEAEDLEATKLPLTLLGTVAASDPQRSWAAVQDNTQRKTLVLRNDDPIRELAKVVRIERRRIVLLEKGAHRELALNEDENGGSTPMAALSRLRGPSRAKRPAPAPRRDTASRTRRLARDRFEVPANDELVRNPASIFQDAQFQPRYEAGQMVGMQINAIKPGSIFEEVGIESGDVITELNGILIDGPEASAELVSEFAEAEEFTVVLDGADGPRTVTFTRGNE